ncbi:MAG: hypothetical protein ACYDA5_10355 [Vulcanimicrobiaceae bacterium]
MPDGIYRVKRATELRELGTFLSQRRLASGVEGLFRADSACRQAIAGEDQSHYFYEVVNLKFTIDEVPRHVLPSDATNLAVELRARVAGSCPETEFDDPFSELNIDIRLTGIRVPSNDRLILAWHLDRVNDDHKPEEIHPLYHFQHGGKTVKESKDLSWGNGLFLDAPRLLHPPLDMVLAVDFVLANFLPTRYVECIEDGLYCRLVRDAQVRILGPFFRSIAAFWTGGNSPSSTECYRYFPTLLKL